MRAKIVAIGGLVLLLAVAAARPAPTRACTGCWEPLADVVRDADRVLLVTVERAEPAFGYRFAVERVLKGRASATLTFPFAGSIRDFPAGTRWILVLYPGHGLDTANAWQVKADGTLVDQGPFDIPTTLRGFLAWFDLPATDAATAADAQVAQSSPLPFALLGAVVGLGLARRRFASARS